MGRTSERRPTIGEGGVVVVGASTGGTTTAVELRARGYEARITLLTEEEVAAYERPGLSKGLLTGEREPRDLLAAEPERLDELDVDVLTGVRAVGLDASAGAVTLDDDRRVAGDAVVLATGAVANRLPVAGADLDGVHVLRTLGHAQALRDGLRTAERVVVVGSSWIGCEVASSCRALGRDVAVVGQEAEPLEAVLGVELGRVLRRLHEGSGVELVMGAAVRRLGGSDGRVASVVLDDGELDADVVVLGVGVEPSTGLARDAGLRVDDGVLVDAELHAGGRVWAVGDVANVAHPRYGRLRTEHWATAADHGRHLARVLTGGPAPFTGLPYFFSDQHGVGLEYVGRHGDGDELLVRGDVEEPRFVAVWLAANGTATATLSVDVWNETGNARRLLRSGSPVDRDRFRAGAPLDQAV